MKSGAIAVICIFVFQLILIVLFAFFTHYGPDSINQEVFREDNESVPIGDPWDSQYPMFQDIHVMVFVGFGFLMTFLRRYAFGAIGFTFLISSLVIQWALLCKGFLHLESLDDDIPISLTSIMNADIAAAVILISLGAVLGKVTVLQLFVMAILETVLFAGNEYIGVEIFHAMDAGGSMYVHAFGAYFGLAVSFVLATSAKFEETPLESSSYVSDVTSMIGTLFLWLFWPSFNAGLLSGEERSRAVINTYMSLTAACVVTFILSAGFSKSLKFEMVHIQNATLAGGVCVGTAANMLVYPYGALLIGSFAGLLSTFGFRFCQGYLLKKIRLHDTCGVNNLHGMPGVAAGLIGSIMAGLSDDNYGDRLESVFPARGPPDSRSPGLQASFQLVGLAITMATSVVGGLITGLIVGKLIPGVPPKEYFNDENFWNISEESKGDEQKQTPA